MNLNRPNPFIPNKNQVAEDWKIWKEEFLVYLKLTNAYAQFSEEQRALLLINFMGTEAIKAMEQIPFHKPDDKKDMDILLIKFDEFFNPALNEMEERYKFFSMRKSPNEGLDKYILDLKEKAAKCNFGNQSEKFIIDMLIISMDENLRQLVWASNLDTLQDIIYNFKQYNMSQEKMKGLSETMAKNLNSENLQNAASHSGAYPRKPAAKRVCSKCGMNHPYKQCLAFDKICQNCFLRGHYTSMCKFDGRNNAMNLQGEESKSSTCKVKQNQEQANKIDAVQHCLWCNSNHTPGKCRHDEECKRCDNFPHLICFQCKKNPHEHTCYYKNILILPILNIFNEPQPNQKKICPKCAYNHESHIPCKHCGTCQAYGHWASECPRKNNQSNNRAPPNVNDLLPDFVEIGNTFQASAQPQRPVPHCGPRQGNPNHHRQNTRPSNNINKEEKSDACCIS